MIYNVFRTGSKKMANKTAGWIQVILGVLLLIWGFTGLHASATWGVWLFGLLVAVVGLWEAMGK